MYANKVMLKQSYYGLVKQNGPWTLTPRDRQHLKERDAVYFGGGIPAGGTKHAGHANWMTSVAYPHRSDGLSANVDFTSYPSVKVTGKYTSSRLNAMSLGLRDRARALARGIGPVQGPPGLPVRQQPGAPGQPPTLQGPPSAPDVVSGPGELPTQVAPFTREPIAPTFQTLPDRLQGEKRKREGEAGMSGVRIDSRKFRKMRGSAGMMPSTEPTTTFTDGAPDFTGPIPGAWPTAAAPVNEPVVEPRNVPTSDAPPGEGEAELNQRQQSNVPDIVEDPFSDANAIPEGTAPSDANPFSDENAIDPTTGTVPTTGATPFVPGPDDFSKTVYTDETMPDVSNQPSVETVSTMRQKMRKKKKERSTTPYTKPSETAVKKSSTETDEVVGAPTATNDKGLIDYALESMKAGVNSIATAVGLGQAAEQSNTPATVIQEAQKTDPGLAQAGALGDAPAPQDMDIDIVKDLGGPEAEDRYTPSMTAERERRKKEKARKKKEETGGFVTRQYKAGETVTAEKRQRIKGGAKKGKVALQVETAPSAGPRKKHVYEGGEAFVKAPSGRKIKVGGKKYNELVQKGEMSPTQLTPPSSPETRRGKRGKK